MFRLHASIWLLLIACAAGLLSCSSMPLHEAQSVVSQADSLWQAGQPYGVDEGDSATLALAYQALNRYAAFYSCVHCPSSLGTSYAHACYHYGRLLRRKDNPVAAMQAFIHATHSSTRDYHILGRVYNNIGDMCHLANEFQLSYDMFERSAQMYHTNGDSLLYYYGLNEMAFELAEQGKKDEAFFLIEQINACSSDKHVLLKTLETKADAYWRVQQYDSAIYCVRNINALGHSEATTTLIMAQAYENLHQKDSALILANEVLADSCASYQNKFNALYIVLHCDSSLCAENINVLASQREDIRYYEYEPEMDKLKKAVQLLLYDLTKKPNLAWLYAMIATFLTIGCISIYVYRKRKHRQLLSQQISDLENKNKATIAQMRHQIDEHCSVFINSHNLKNDLCWNDFDKMCGVVNQHFGLLASKLRQSYHLSEREIRLCVLSLLNMSYDQMADYLIYAPNGIGKFKTRVAQKLGTTSKNLRQFLINKAING